MNEPLEELKREQHFDFLKKIEFSNENKEFYKEFLYFYDFQKKCIINIKDILSHFKIFDFVHDNNNIQSCIVKFLNLQQRKDKEFENIIIKIWLSINKKYDDFFIIPKWINSKYIYDEKNILEKIKYFRNKVPFPEKNINFLKSYNESTIKKGLVIESECEIFIITKENHLQLINCNINLPSSITISFMKYKNITRYGKQQRFNLIKNASHENLIIEFMKNNENLCYCICNSHLIHIYFYNSTTDDQVKIIETFKIFDILCINKTNISFSYIPNPSLNRDLMFLVLDLMYSGDYMNYIFINELKNTYGEIEKKNLKGKPIDENDMEKIKNYLKDNDIEVTECSNIDFVDILNEINLMNLIPYINDIKLLLVAKKSSSRISFYICGRKYNLTRSDGGNEIHIKTQSTDKLRSPLELFHITYFFDKFFEEFHKKVVDTITFYTNYNKAFFVDITSNTQITKELINNLRQHEPNLFGKSTFPEDCQYSKQPYIVESIQEFENKFKDDELDKFLKENNVEGDTREEKVKKLVLSFPPENFEKERFTNADVLQTRLYACIPRIISKKSNKDLRTSYPFPAWRIKPNELNRKKYPFLSNESYFKNIENEQITMRYVICCYKMPIKSDIGVKQKKDTRSSHILGKTKNVQPLHKGMIQEYIGSMLTNIFRIGKETFEKVILDTILSSNIKSKKLIIDTIKKNTNINVIKKFQNVEFNEDNLNFWSFLLNINIILFDVTENYNSHLISFIVPDNIIFPYKSFLFVGCNTIRTFEIIGNDDFTIHNIENNNIFIKYINFLLENKNKETIFY